MRVCRRCELEQPECNFPLRERWRSWTCRSCESARRRNKGDWRALRYGISPAEYDQMMQERDSRCDICGKQFAVLALDHCHTTGKVRGLLCRIHNTAIGFMGDDDDLVWRAWVYLRRHK